MNRGERALSEVSCVPLRSVTTDRGLKFYLVYVMFLQGDFGTFSIDVDGAGECYKAFNVIPSGGYRSTEVKLTVVDQELLDYENPACRVFDLEVNISPLL